MVKREFYYESSCKTTKIRAVKYIPASKVVAVLQIAHGMKEFIDRYEPFAQYLTAQGILVVGNDHLGHGGSINNEDDWGYFCEKDANRVLIDDMYQLTILTKQEYSDVPYFLLGHSMGSFYARQYLCEYGYELNGAIIMGTGHEPKIVVLAGMLMCRIIALFKGWHHRSGFMNNMVFGSYNKIFEPARTKFDWLTRNNVIVDRYLAEPRCTFMFTLNAYYNMFKGIYRLHNKKLLHKVPMQMPIYFVSGKQDPVGSFGKEVDAAAKSLKDVGCFKVEEKLFSGDRHEILNELDRDVVFNDLINWLKKQMTLR